MLCRQRDKERDSGVKEMKRDAARGAVTEAAREKGIPVIVFLKVQTAHHVLGRRRGRELDK